MSTPLIRLWYALTALVVSCVVIAGVSIQYSNWTRAKTIEETERQQRESDRRWCELLTTMDTAYTEQPPRSPTGTRLAQQISELRTQFGCDGP